MPIHAQAGDVIDGRLRLLSLLGEGTVGVVWSAEPLDGGPPRALKLFRAEVGDEILRRRFVNEAQVSIESLHVVAPDAVGEHNGHPYLVMDLLEGEDLRQRLARGALGSTETWHVIDQVGRALKAAHAAGVVHRDLKPANIFLCAGATPPLVKVLDFGLAKLSSIDGGVHTNTGDQIGTPAYMCPEQLRSSKSVGPVADLWALAVVAYHCLLGEKPFRATRFGDLVLEICAHPPPVPSAHGTVPPGFDAWFARGVARRPEDRFVTAEEMVEAFREVLFEITPS